MDQTAVGAVAIILKHYPEAQAIYLLGGKS